ncbi:gamma-glutamyltransferase family protein [Thermodesulforhabdus norvegica]|uniref:Gamma-glutamyltranspeptidase / glutathione hydrolase n=1 Tax=Thermodesulforhabdus norvegica TaxID=39841 RepID=A0A1I4TQC2_9BACT|nr:gamma-glutamyltransferase family protein [Thermodesulforhabdus norvegica]SFM78964.1 gamma-glutamyltranspeptidase / glutathione hydrolase [Thermodesulforhabdus norvegica]
MRVFSASVDLRDVFTCKGSSHAIATEHYLSAQVGLSILKSGGNAFDAAVAATFVEGLVNPHMFTPGGECPMLLYLADLNRVVSVNGNTQAPSKATIDEYLSRGIDIIPPSGVFSAGVPAAVAALLDVLAEFGSMPLEEVLAPARELALKGFPVHEGLVYMDKFGIQHCAERFRNEWPNSAKLYLTEDGKVPEPGGLMKNPAYASFLDALIEASRKGGEDRRAGIIRARELFYRGDIAREIEAFVRELDGLLSYDDMASYVTFMEEPVRVSFRNTVVFKCGPWSQGPVFLQMLKILEGFDLRALGHNSAEYLHLWIEAAKLAFADREQYYADPRFVRVPLRELLDEEYASVRRGLIDFEKASLYHRPGDPLKKSPLLSEEKIFRSRHWGYGTVHVAVADEKGNLAALTPSGAWISGNEVVPFLGFPLGNRLQTFYLEEGHPNCLQPGKRPRTTLSPSLAFRDSRPWMAFGTMGGDQQDQWTLQFFLNMVVFGMSMSQALEAPKLCTDHFPGTFYPHEVSPGRVRVEERISHETIRELERRGHKIVKDPPWRHGFICAVCRREDGSLEAGADPRGRFAGIFPSCALAW